jgi:hypothetical protein
MVVGGCAGHASQMFCCCTDHFSFYLVLDAMSRGIKHERSNITVGPLSRSFILFSHRLYQSLLNNANPSLLCTYHKPLVFSALSHLLQ